MAEQLVIALAGISIRCLALGLIAALVTLPIRSAALRHAIWVAVLAGMLLMPFLPLIAPPIRVAVVPRPIMTAPPPVSAPEPVVAPQPVSRPSTPRVETRTLPAPPARIEAPPPAPAPSKPFPWMPLLCGVYAAGVVAFLARLACAWRAIHRIAAASVSVPLPFPELRESPEVRVPMVAGARRPIVLLPPEWTGWSERKLRAVLAHEFAHIRRRDWITTFAAAVNRSLFWFHPLAWLVERRLAALAELACDDISILETGDASGYAEVLLDMAALPGIHGRLILHGGAMASSSNVGRRIDRILESRHRSGLLSRRRWIAVAACITPLLLIAAGAQVGRQSPAHDAQPESCTCVLQDDTGTSLASVEVKFRKAGVRELIADLETDRQGRFAIAELPPGDYQVEASKPNFITAKTRVTLPAPGLPIRLVRYGVIAGQVLDAQGNPAPGVLRIPTGRSFGGTYVWLMVKPPGAASPRPFRQATQLDTAGRFRLGNLPPGQYALAVSYSALPGESGSGLMFYPDNQHARYFSIFGGEEYDGIVFSILPASHVRVSGAVQQPRPGLKFGYSLVPTDHPELPLVVDQTDDNGTFKMDGIPPGSYELFVSGPAGGYGPWSMGAIILAQPLFGHRHLDVFGQDIEGLSIPVSEGKTVRFVLRPDKTVSSDDMCPDTATLELAPIEMLGANLFRDLPVGSATETEVQNLAPSHYRLRVFRLGDTCFARESILDLSSSDPGTVAIPITAAGSIRGSLTGAANPTAYAVVLVPATAVENGPPLQVEFPDGQGLFHFAGIAPGSYRIGVQAAATAKGRWVADAGKMFEIEVAGGAPTDLDLPAPKEQ